MLTRTLTALLLGGLAALAAAPPASADESEDRLTRLERLLEEQARQMDVLRREIAAARAAAARKPEPVTAPAPAPAAAPTPAPTPGPTSIPMAAPALGADPQLAQQFLSGRGPASGGVRWGGYVTLEFVGATDANSHFDIHRAVLALGADVTDCIDIAAEFEFEHGGIGGGSRDGDVKLEHFTIRWHLNDSIYLTVGAPLIPFGRYNLFHDDPINDFTKRPWLARFFMATGDAQPGIGLGGSCPLGCGAISWDTLVSAGFDDGFTNSGGVRGARQSWRGDNNESKQLWGHVAYTQAQGPLDYLEVGGSLTWGRYDDADDNTVWGFGVDLLAREGPFELKGEYMRYDIERDAADPATAVRGMDGLWVELGYHFMPCALRGCSSCVVRDTSHFTFAARYQTIDLDDRRTGSHLNDDRTGFGLALNYRLTERTVIRIDHTWLDAESAADEREWTFSFSTYF